MRDICILIPVLNEEKNVTRIFNKLSKLNFKFDIVFIDDNSKDKTKNIILKLIKKNKNIYYLFRKKKRGIGSAHKDGIKWCYKKKYSTIVSMDCDGTHDPKYIPILLKSSKLYDMVITTRFKKVSSLKSWPYYRKMLTFLRFYLSKLILNLNFDSSGAFRCFRTMKIDLKDITSIKSNNYDFFLESIFFLKNKYSINEVPIKLPFRTLGKSKMTYFHILQYLYKLFLLKFN